MYLVTRYDSRGYGGLAYGNNECNEAFGTIVARNRLLAVQGWCDDFISSVRGTDEGWLIQSAVYEGGLLKHYKDGELLDTQSHTYNTVPTVCLLYTSPSPRD